MSSSLPRKPGRDEQILAARNAKVPVKDIARTHDISAERVRQVFRNAGDTSNVVDQDLCLYVLGPQTKAAIKTASDQEIKTADEFKAWIAKIAPGCTSARELAKALAKQNGFRNPHSRVDLVRAVVGISFRLGIIDDRPFISSHMLDQ